MREKEWYDKPWVEPSNAEVIREIEEAVLADQDVLDITHITVDNKVKTCASCWWNSIEGMDMLCNHTGQKKAGWFDRCAEWRAVVTR